MLYTEIDSTSINPKHKNKKGQKNKKKRCPFRRDEDELLKKLVEEFGDQDWMLIAKKMKGRSLRQCRDRWINNLCSTVVKSKWTHEEDLLLFEKYQLLGSKWKSYEAFFPGRTSYNIRNRWNCLQRFQNKIFGSTTMNQVNNQIQNDSNQQLNTKREVKNDDNEDKFFKTLIDSIFDLDEKEYSFFEQNKIFF